MPSKGTAAVTLSNDWSGSLSSLEVVGDWSAIAETYRQTEVRPLRLKASAALALAYTADLVEAEKIIRETRDAQELQGDFTSLFFLAMAAASMCRRQRRWELAKFSALKAYVLSRKLKSREEEAAAIYSIALCLAGMGRQFLAMDCYQRIRRMADVGPYRKGLAAINEAYILWDLGSWAEMQKLLPQIPSSYQPRMKLMLDLVQMDHTSLELLMASEAPSKIQGELRAIIIYLLHASYVFGNELLLRAEEPWVDRVVRRLDREERTDFWSQALARARRNETIDYREDERLDWRTELDHRFLSFLSRAAHVGAAEARRLYQTQIDPFVQSRSLLIPLIPPLHQIENPRTAWAQMLANLIGQKGAEVDRDSVLEARVIDHRLRLYRNKQELASVDLRRSATSLRVLQIIAGERGREISKQKLHEALTGTRYSPKLHDQRLQKLFKRLEREVTAVVGESLWCWPGTNSLRLLRSIAYES